MEDCPARVLEETLERPDGLSSPSAARRFHLRARLRDLPHEVFCCFCRRRTAIG